MNFSKTTAFTATQNNCGSPTPRHTSWPKREFCEMVPPCDTRYRSTQTGFIILWRSLISSQWKSECRNGRYWSAENSTLFHQVPLHDVKVGVAFYKCNQDNWAHFFRDILNSQRNVTHILKQFFYHLHEHERTYACFSTKESNSKQFHDLFRVSF